MTTEQLTALARAIKDGKCYHVFDKRSGGYLSSFYYPSSVRSYEDDREYTVKYLTRS